MGQQIPFWSLGGWRGEQCAYTSGYLHVESNMQDTHVQGLRSPL